MIDPFDIPTALNAIFQLAAIFTGILFSIYCFVIVSSNPFIDRIKGTETYKLSRSYVKKTLSLGFFITVVSLGAATVAQPLQMQCLIFITLSFLTVWWLWRLIGCVRRFDILAS